MSRKQSIVALGLVLAGLSATPVLYAQNLEMVPQPAATSTAATPSRGMTMGQVEKRFGAPAERYAPVGQPPITRWVYTDKVVYFEYDHVVHAVVVRN
ncbi:MAG TPA: hypothetical protein VFP48_11705 [Steroidobacteraceae bacterium]|nr:hypothetical protein [Steroidobacteraceae bacterium]